VASLSQINKEGGEKMKKKWTTIMAATLVLLVLASNASVALAQSEQEATDSVRPMFKPGLAIVAPRMYPVGEEAYMSVFDRPTQKPVKDATIWALTREQAEALKARLEELKESDTPTQDVDWESLVSSYGFSLGTTHGNGQLKYTFEEEGWYMLIALKEGYIPGRTGIAIKNPPEPSPKEIPNSDNPTR
jgi:hypothetical protein